MEAPSLLVIDPSPMFRPPCRPQFIDYDRERTGYPTWKAWDIFTWHEGFYKRRNPKGAMSKVIMGTYTNIKRSSATHSKSTKNLFLCRNSVYGVNLSPRDAAYIVILSVCVPSYMKLVGLSDCTISAQIKLDKIVQNRGKICAQPHTLPFHPHVLLSSLSTMHC